MAGVLRGGAAAAGLAALAVVLHEGAGPQIADGGELLPQLVAAGGQGGEVERDGQGGPPFLLAYHTYRNRPQGRAAGGGQPRPGRAGGPQPLTGGAGRLRTLAASLRHAGRSLAAGRGGRGRGRALGRPAPTGAHGPRGRSLHGGCADSKRLFPQPVPHPAAGSTLTTKRSRSRIPRHRISRSAAGLGAAVLPAGTRRPDRALLRPGNRNPPPGWISPLRPSSSLPTALYLRVHPSSQNIQ